MGILSVVLALVAILCALLATFLFGTMGGVVAGVLGVAAIVLAVLKRKKDGKGGIAGITIGVIAVVLAFSMTSAWSSMFTQIHQKALEVKPDGLWAKVSEDTSGGFMGILNRLPKDEASMNALMKEMDELNTAMNQK